jgi:hypothetical protein
MWLGFSLEFWATTLITFLLAVVTLALTAPTKKRKLSFVVANCTDLVSDLAPLGPNLEISYKKAAIKNKLLWIRGAITNVGNLDVGSSIIAEFPILSLHKGAHWLELNVSEATPGIQVESSILSSEKAAIRWKLLKPDESIQFNALVAACPDTCNACRGVGRCLSIDSRIEDTTFVPPKEALASSEEILLTARYRASTVVSYFALLVISVFLFGWVSWQTLTNNRVYFDVDGNRGVYAFSCRQAQQNLIDLEELGGKNSISMEPRQVTAKNFRLVQYLPQRSAILLSGTGAMVLWLCWLSVSRARTTTRLFRRYHAMRNEASILDLFPLIQKWLGRRTSSHNE